MFRLFKGILFLLFCSLAKGAANSPKAKNEEFILKEMLQTFHLIQPLLQRFLTSDFETY